MKTRWNPSPQPAISNLQYQAFVKQAARADTAGRLDRYPDLHPSHVDERFPYFDSAVANHSMWHQKEVEGAYLKDFSFPESMVCIGRAYEIVYVSDKWEKHADFFSYVHHFDSHPEVYASAETFIGKRPRSTARLLGVKGVSDDDKLATPILARVTEFIIQGHDGQMHALRFDFPPLMLCSPDKEGLLILSDHMGPLVVRGGQMEINERGIVK